MYEDDIPKGLLRQHPVLHSTVCGAIRARTEVRSNVMERWEEDMRAQGYGMIMTSTRVDEDAQRFYRKLGYKDCGGFTGDIQGFEQPMELLLSKAI